MSYASAKQLQGAALDKYMENKGKERQWKSTYAITSTLIKIEQAGKLRVTVKKKKAVTCHDLIHPIKINWGWGGGGGGEGVRKRLKKEPLFLRILLDL